MEGISTSLPFTIIAGMVAFEGLLYNLFFAKTRPMGRIEQNTES